MNSRKKKFFSYYKPHLGLFISVMACAFLVAGITLLIPLCIHYITKNILEANAPDVLEQILQVGALMLGLLLLHTVCNFYVDYRGHAMGAMMESDMRSELFAHYQKLSFRFFDDQRTGQLMSRLTNDLLSLAELYHHGPEDYAIYSVKFIGAFIILFNIDATLTADICGVPARTIKALARQWAKKATSIAHGNGGGYIRSCYSHEPARLEVMLLGMQGLGKPGRNQVKMIEWGLFSLYSQIPGPRPEVIPAMTRATYKGWQFTLPAQFIPKTLAADAILNPPLTWWGTSLAGWPREDQFNQYKYPADGCSEVLMLWTDQPCLDTCWNNTNRVHQALRDPKIEFIVAQHPWMENECLFADIVLPTTTKFEQEDIQVDQFSGQFNTLLYEGQSIKPIGESKSCYETVAEIAMVNVEKMVAATGERDWFDIGESWKQSPWKMNTSSHGS